MSCSPLIRGRALLAREGAASQTTTTYQQGVPLLCRVSRPVHRVAGRGPRIRGRGAMQEVSAPTVADTCDIGKLSRSPVATIRRRAVSSDPLARWTRNPGPAPRLDSGPPPAISRPPYPRTSSRPKTSRSCGGRPSRERDPCSACGRIAWRSGVHHGHPPPGPGQTKAAEGPRRRRRPPLRHNSCLLMSLSFTSSRMAVTAVLRQLLLLVSGRPTPRHGSTLGTRMTGVPASADALTG